MNMEERALLRVSEGKTTRRYLHGARLTLDFELPGEREDDGLFPFIPPALPHS